MVTIGSVTLDVPDTSAAKSFYNQRGSTPRVRRRGADAGTGFRGYTLSLVVSSRTSWTRSSSRTRRRRHRSETGEEESVGVRRRRTGPRRGDLEGRDVVKKNTGPAERRFDDIVLLLGVDDVKASKQFYVDRGLEVAKSYGRKYVEFATEPGTVNWRCTGVAPLAKDAASRRPEPAPTGSSSAATSGLHRLGRLHVGDHRTMTAPSGRHGGRTPQRETR